MNAYDKREGRLLNPLVEPVEKVTISSHGSRIQVKQMLICVIE
jgi:hypothetical protein